MTQLQEDANVRMREDVKRALSKPVEERSWVMVIDIEKCIGCHACTISCIAENVSPPGVTYRKVFDIETGEYPDVKRLFMPTNCMHCDNPPCAKAANAIVPGAIEKRPDGIVVLNYKKFRGKKVFEAATIACPYTAFYYDDGSFYTQNTPKLESYETRPSFEYGKKWIRKKGKDEPPIETGRKCHFCLHRLNAGMVPACVTTCTGRAMYFGDLNDPQSLVAELLKNKPSYRVNENLGTKPRVYYLHGTYTEKELKEGCAACHE